MSSVSFARRGLWVAAGLIALLVTMGVAGSVYLMAASDRLLHSSEAVDALDRMTAGLTDLETSARGFALTADPEYLQPATPALTQIDLSYRLASDHLAGRRANMDRLAVIHDLVKRRVEVADRVIGAVRDGRPDDAAAIIRSGQGRVLHDQVRQHVRELRSVLDQDTERSRSGLRSWVIGLVAAVILVGAICFGLLYLSWRTLQRAIQADVERRRAARRQAGIVDDSPDLILTARSGRITFINAAGAQLLGATPDELVGRMLGGIFAPGSPFPRDHLPALEAAAGVAPVAVNNLVGAHGQTVQAAVRGFSAEGVDGLDITLMARDVSEVERLNAQLQRSQRLESLGKLTGGVAHDFNNLLTVITGCTETMAEILSRREQEEEEMLGLTNVVSQAAEQGAALTRHLLAFARRQPLSPRRLDVKKAIVDATPLLKRTLGEDIALTTHLADGLCDVVIDASMLENALLNLCLNARHAMPTGGHLTVEAEQIELDRDYANWNEDIEPGSYVRLSVTDDGEGMPQAVLDRAFEPFFSTRGQGEGSGLGLSMVYGFMKQSGGHAKIYSEPGQGTTVNLYIPCAGLNAPWSEVTREPSELEGGTETILIVEDDELVRQHVERQLRNFGYDVEVAANGADALDLLRNRAFDLLFTDVVMPGGMNGRQLADAAIVMRPELKVLFTSGYTENAIVHQGRLDPGVHLLQKPYRRTELAAAVRKLLGRA